MSPIDEHEADLREAERLLGVHPITRALAAARSSGMAEGAQGVVDLATQVARVIESVQNNLRAGNVESASIMLDGLSRYLVERGAK